VAPVATGVSVAPPREVLAQAKEEPPLVPAAPDSAKVHDAAPPLAPSATASPKTKLRTSAPARPPETSEFGGML
jgi:hypothetical protein